MCPYGSSFNILCQTSCVEEKKLTSVSGFKDCPQSRMAAAITDASEGSNTDMLTLVGDFKTAWFRITMSIRIKVNQD